MKPQHLAFALATLAAAPAMALNIVITNDDGFEASTVAALKQRLIAAGHSAIVCASTQDNSGKGGSLDFLRPMTPLTKDTRGGFVKAGAPGVGTLPADADVHYVDSTPVGSALYCIDVATFNKWGQTPDLLISGPNYGNNTGLINNSSGTFNAGEIALNRGIPSIVVSAAMPSSYKTYDKLMAGDPEFEDADIVVRLVNELVKQKPLAGGELLPVGTALNVNIPGFAPGQAGNLPFKLTQVGSAPSATPYFVPDLGNDANAAAFGLAGVHYPGVSVALPGQSLPSGLSQVIDTNPDSEQNAVSAGFIAISVIKGNHQAMRVPEAEARFKLRKLVK